MLSPFSVAGAMMFVSELVSVATAISAYVVLVIVVRAPSVQMLHSWYVGMSNASDKVHFASYQRYDYKKDLTGSDL